MENCSGKGGWQSRRRGAKDEARVKKGLDSAIISAQSRLEKGLVDLQASVKTSFDDNQLLKSLRPPTLNGRLPRSKSESQLQSSWRNFVVRNGTIGTPLSLKGVKEGKEPGRLSVPSLFNVPSAPSLLVSEQFLCTSGACKVVA
jgi:hypothetical protein